MCTTDLCNANDYNFHTERANQLFGRPPQSAAVVSPFSTVAAATLQSRIPVTIVTPSSTNLEENDIIDITEEVDSTKVQEDGGKERTEVLWSEKKVDDDLFKEQEADAASEELPRFPRQSNTG
jgi:hypothetical protein